MPWLVCGMIWGSSALVCTRALMYLYRRTDWLNACNVSGAIIVVLVILVRLDYL